MENIDDLLAELKDVRERQSTTKGLMNKMIEDVKESEHYKNFQTMNETENQIIASLEEKINTIAMEQFGATQDKSVHDKVKIKIFRVFKIVEENTVVQWVKTNLADAMVMDEQKVKDYALKIGNVPGTEVIEEPRVQIASKL